MDIFIGNLPEHFDGYELRKLFRGFESSAKFSIVDKKSYGRRVRYGLAVIEPSSEARRAIEALNLLEVQGQPIVVREFTHRSYGNERRALNWRERRWNGPERRQTERRGRVGVAG